MDKNVARFATRRQTSVPVILDLFVTVHAFLLGRMCLIFAALGTLQVLRQWMLLYSPETIERWHVVPLPRDGHGWQCDALGRDAYRIEFPNLALNLRMGLSNGGVTDGRQCDVFVSASGCVKTAAHLTLLPGACSEACLACSSASLAFILACRAVNFRCRGIRELARSALRFSRSLILSSVVDSMICCFSCIDSQPKAPSALQYKNTPRKETYGLVLLLSLESGAVDGAHDGDGGKRDCP